jgi:hypothetical protein
MKRLAECAQYEYLLKSSCRFQLFLPKAYGAITTLRCPSPHPCFCGVATSNSLFVCSRSRFLCAHFLFVISLDVLSPSVRRSKACQCRYHANAAPSLSLCGSPLKKTHSRSHSTTATAASAGNNPPRPLARAPFSRLRPSFRSVRRCGRKG